MEKLNDFMMLFRLVPDLNHQPNETELSKQEKQWGVWIGSIASQAKLISTSRLGFKGKQLYANHSVVNGINISNQMTLGGNMVVKARSIDDVIEMAKGCPILGMGGTVEVREIIPM